MTDYQRRILRKLRERHDHGRPWPPCGAHALVGTRGHAPSAGRALARLEEQGYVRDTGGPRPRYVMTDEGFKFTHIR